MMLSSPDNSRSALAGFDPDVKTAFVYLFGEETKIANLYVKYVEEDQEAAAKQSLSLPLMLWLNSADNKECNDLITEAAAEEVIEGFFKSVQHLHPNWDVWAEKYDKKTDKMVKI